MTVQERMTPEQCAGYRIRERRKELGMTATQFGSRLGGYLRTPWSRQAVSHAESGHRAFAAAEMVVIAHVLDMPLRLLYTPPIGVREVAMPGGGTLPAHAIERGTDEDEAGVFYAEMTACLAQAREALEKAGSGLARLLGYFPAEGADLAAAAAAGAAFAAAGAFGAGFGSSARL